VSRIPWPVRSSKYIIAKAVWPGGPILLKVIQVEKGESLDINGTDALKGYTII